MKKCLLKVSTLLSLIGCGYSPTSFDNDSMQQVTVAITERDDDGVFQPMLERALVMSGRVHTAHDASYRLEVTLVDDTVDQVGFQFDRDTSTGHLLDRLIPMEERRDLRAEVCLYSVAKKKTLFGPITITGSSQYDFVDPDFIGDVSFVDAKGVRSSTLDLSLGQLDSVEGARSVSKETAFSDLSERIVECVLHALEKERDNYP